MSFNDIDDTLVAYFKQMLEEECEQQSTEAESQSEEKVIAKTEPSAQSENEQVIGSDTEVSETQVDETVLEQDSEVPQEDMDMTSAEESVSSDETVDESAEEEVVAQEAVADESVPEEAVAEYAASEDIEMSSAEEQSDSPAEETEAAIDTQVESEMPAESEESAAENTDTEVQAESAADDIDYAADDYVPEDNSSSDDVPPLQPQLQTVEEKPEPLPFAEHKSLESLLESVPKTHLETEIAVETPTETAVETAVETQTVTETAVEEQTQVEQVAASESVVADENVAQAEQEAENDEAPYNWTNIEMPEEFQVLFFLVKGIRFAVPLVNLGGIFQCDKVTPLFGKPDWFQGIADIRGRKMNVVDTLKWVKSDAPQSDKYEYMISLDKTLWSIGCDVLEGNRILSKENITWRQTAGNRPWLAGIVKKEMCALLHVKALIKMFENGVNLKDLDAQMSA
ncbi:purine-binding chemotaxis protein CheW [Succinivibrio dextrinosolvens]|uniref:chemotaxis protein CheW n=1 Tax=Succinivibrio dextrinosolvens TaxID=83771 RepID=UPI0008E3F95B|nr:chemotaxis protein CheW [Succinivibrio dextrinosolvens]SFS37617.1 purine-binding chemotaxis protein CheW [Succinivibrio dextrinosolvens]